MSMQQILIVIFIWLCVGLVLFFAVRYWMIRERVRARLSGPSEDQSHADELGREIDSKFLTRWLFVSGFRSERSPLVFISLTLLGLLSGGAFVALVFWLGAVSQFVDLLVLVPGGVGEVFLPVAWLSPWIGLLIAGTLPTLYVRAQRRKRVQAIEQDLPLTLDLLATLAEAGLSFDSALDRVLESQPQQRPLTEDLRLFQVDTLAGRPRIDALRRLMQRVDVTWFSIFVSAIMHAEQVGSSLANTLRTQADDLRVRRRERAMAMAMAIPVKLLVPLIVCFLPGIMTAAMGPILYQIVQVLDSFLRGAVGG